MSLPLFNGILLLICGFLLSFSALGAPKDCDKLLLDAAVQGVTGNTYSQFDPVRINAGVKKFKKSIEDLSKSTHPLSIQLQTEVIESEFQAIYLALEAVAKFDRGLPDPMAGLAYKYIDVMLVFLEPLQPTHPSYVVIRQTAALRLELLKATIERPPDGMLN